jgi:hypothetical protein
VRLETLFVYLLNCDWCLSLDMHSLKDLPKTAIIELLLPLVLRVDIFNLAESLNILVAQRLLYVGCLPFFSGLTWHEFILLLRHVSIFSSIHVDFKRLGFERHLRRRRLSYIF